MHLAPTKTIYLVYLHDDFISYAITVQCWAIEWNLCIMSTFQKSSDYQGVLVFQFILHDKLPFGTSNKCADNTGVLVFKCLH